MTVGFASLAKLKRACLPPSLQTDTRWDTVLTDIGLAVAAAIGNECNRDFERAAGTTFTRPADGSAFSVPRYPLEAVSAAVVRRVGSSSDENVLDSLANVFPDSGIVEFSAILGTYQDKLTLTYTGGYWWDDSVAQTTPQPSGSTALPKDLERAWLLQCQNIIERTRILKMGALEVSKEGEYAPGLSKVELLPGVKDMLGNFIRYA